MKRSVFILLVSLLFSSVSWGDFDSAMRSFEGKDYSSAANEFKKLSAANDSDAQYMLGYLYATGKGVLKDYVEAHKWFNLAASHGNKNAIKARAGVEKHMSREQISLAQSQARNWSSGGYKAPALEIDESITGVPKANKAPTVGKELRDRESVRLVQRKLAQLGYRPGPADGAMGKKTRQAIREYQRDNQLVMNSKITQSLIDLLYPNDVQGVSQVISEAGGDLLFPKIWGNNGEDSIDNEQLQIDLAALLEKGRQRRAAQAWFLNDLSKLINQNQTVWTVSVLEDDFQDGDFTSSPRWSVLSGTFDVTGQGLSSQSTAQVAAQAQESQDLSTAILGAILERATRSDEEDKPVNKTNEIAKIIIKQAIPASFALKAKLTFQSDDSRAEFGPYVGNTNKEGYQLMVSPEQEQIELLSITSRGSSEKKKKRKKISLNQSHVFEWLRDDAGMMTVAMDGEQLFQVSDRRYKNNFSGFLLKNSSGSMILHEIKIIGKK